MIATELLHAEPERHIRCNPTLAQFIVAEDFAAIHVEGDFDKSQLDQAHVRKRESLITRGWNRLKEIRSLGEVSILEFPLPEAIEKFKNRATSMPSPDVTSE